MFPIDCLSWIQPDLVLPGELVDFSWLEFYQGKQDSRKGSKASSSTWRRRTRRKGKRSIASSSHEACESTPAVLHALHEDEAYKAFESESESRVAGFALQDEDILPNESASKSRVAGFTLQDADIEECVICMDGNAEYAWDGCEHHRPLVCSVCARQTNEGLSSTKCGRTDCCMCRATSHLTLYVYVCTHS